MGFDFLDFGFPKSGTDWKSINGKPFITVSSKGRSNGLSTKINDGADFGPDTTLNAMSPSQTGPPYTQTSGIQEAINYVQEFANTIHYNIAGTWMPELRLKEGAYIINDNATIYINNAQGQFNPNGFHMVGTSHSQYDCIIIKENSLPSPILSFTNPRGSSNANSPIQMIFENFNVQYTGPSANATSGVTVVNLSIPEMGGTGNVFRNLMVMSKNPINNVMLDVSGSEDAIIDNVFTYNIGGTYNSNITLASLKTHMSGGNVKIYNGVHSGIDIETTNAHISGSTIGSGAGAGIIWRPTISGAALSLDGVYFNGALTRLITVQNTTSGNSYFAYININGCLLSKTPISSGDYMLALNATYLRIRSTTLVNNNSSDTLYLFNPNSFGVQAFEGFDNVQGTTYILNNVTINLPFIVPSVPASGTAQKNINSFPVNVYLYDGTVTEIQITKNGSTYTVLSNASGLALSGQVYKLGVYESITITYTAAPTWVWVRD